MSKEFDNIIAQFSEEMLEKPANYLGLCIKAIAEKTNYVFDENRYFDDFIEFFEKRLKPYSKMIEEHQDALKNL